MVKQTKTTKPTQNQSEAKPAVKKVLVKKVTTETKQAVKTVVPKVQPPKAPKAVAKVAAVKAPSKTTTVPKVKKAPAKRAAKRQEVDVSDVEDATEPVDDVDVEDDEEGTDEVRQKVPRVPPTIESVTEDFDALIRTIVSQVESVRESGTSGIKFLRSLNKQVKLLKAKTIRLAKQKQRTGRKNNLNSGFLKKVAISKDLAEFTGWDENEMYSRVQVTKFVCDYIRENNLQNPEDRREIFPDEALQNLLNFNENKEGKLKYYTLQKYLTPNFIKEQL